MKGYALCIIAEIWTLLLPIHYRKMLIDTWSGMDQKNIVLLVANRWLSIPNWPGNKLINLSLSLSPSHFLLYKLLSCKNKAKQSKIIHTWTHGRVYSNYLYAMRSISNLLSGTFYFYLIFYFLAFCSYVRQADNFYDVAVLNAGHMVPTDQPVVALELIDRFIHNTLWVVVLSWFILLPCKHIYISSLF